MKQWPIALMLAILPVSLVWGQENTWIKYTAEHPEGIEVSLDEELAKQGIFDIEEDIEDEEIELPSYSPDTENNLVALGEPAPENITNQLQHSGKTVLLLKGNRAFCSGALVGPRVVLTAAHCLSEQDIQTLSIESPAYKKTSTVSSIYINPDYIGVNLAGWAQLFPVGLAGIAASALVASDYGLLVLKEPLGNTTGYYGINSDFSRYNIFKQDSLWVLGRGRSKHAHTIWRSSGHVMYTNTMILRFTANIEPGNSGGPIVLKEAPDKIISLVSAGSKLVDNDSAGPLMSRDLIKKIKKLRRL